MDKSAAKEHSVLIMNSAKAYEEVIDFIAAETTPQNVIDFRPAKAAQARVEHLMRLTKARARGFLPNE